MKSNLSLRWLLACLSFVCLNLGIQAQGLEGIIVEEYYADGPAPGNVTYRVYVDMAPDYNLLQVFGFDNDDPGIGNALEINTTTSFYNDPFGVQFGEALNTALFPVFNNASLDSYICFGGAAVGQKGIPKADDNDGSNLVPFLTNVPSDGIAPSSADGYTAGSNSGTNTLNMTTTGVTGPETL